MSDASQAFIGSAGNSNPAETLARALEARLRAGSWAPLAYASDIDETQYCSEGLPGRDPLELDRASEALKGLLEAMRAQAGTIIIHNTGKEYPWGGYQTHRSGSYNPILAAPDAVIAGGGAHIFLFPEGSDSPQELQAWRDHLAAEAGTDDLWPVVGSFSRRDTRIQLLGREWSQGQFIDDPLRVPCQWVSNQPFDIMEADRLVKQALGPHMAAFIYTGFPNAFDIRPASMNKRDSNFFLLDHLGIDPLESVFAGDSMNDYHLLTDDRLNRIVVANASRQLTGAIHRHIAAGQDDSDHPRGNIYFCQGDEVAASGVMRGLEDLMDRKPAAPGYDAEPRADAASPGQP